jgi:hypothetical protein
MFVGRKLALTLAFTVLVALAFGVSCRGFFQPNVLESIVIQPPSVNFEVNATQQFSAYGTYQDGTRALISSGVVWSSDSPSITITAGGNATGLSVTTAAATITGSAQGLSGTATASVIGDVTTITVSPTSATISAESSVTFTFAATPGPPNFITDDNGGTLSTLPADGIFTCSVGVNAENNPAEVCTLSSTTGASASYTVQMSYPGLSGVTINSPMVTVTVTGG